MTHQIIHYHINPFWDTEYQNLQYEQEPFNDQHSLQRWLDQGYSNKFTGLMCDMRRAQPSWNQRFVEFFRERGWNNIGTSYYRMDTGTVLPTHGDLYSRYVKLFDLKGREHHIRRAIVFLEPWKSGHYFEALGQALTGWQAGYTVEWTYDTPHMAANLGPEPRYTLQITGHL